MGGNPETKMLKRSTCFSAVGGGGGGTEAQETGGLRTYVARMNNRACSLGAPQAPPVVKKPSDKQET